MNVSIIIPTLNEESNIADCIESAVASNPWEIIVADGGSNDRTIEIASSQNVQVVCSKKGRAFQQNAGAAEATGDILLFLHADCRLPSTALDQIADAFETRAARIGGFRQHIAASGLLFRALEIGNAARILWLRTPYGDQGIFIARELFESAGGFPRIPIMEDLQLMRTLQRHNRPHLLPGPLVVDARRWKKNGIIRQTLRNWRLVFGWATGRMTPTELGRRYPVCNDSHSTAATRVTAQSE